MAWGALLGGLLQVRDQRVPVLFLLQTREHHLGARDVPGAMVKWCNGEMVEWRTGEMVKEKVSLSEFTF